MSKKYRRHYFILVAALLSLAATLLFLLEAIFSKHLAYDFPFISYGGTFRWSSFKIGSADISLYWSAHVVGILAMCLVCVLRKDRYEIKTYQAIITGVLLGVFGFIGAKALFIIENFKPVMQNGIGVGGVSFFGTVLFMPLVIPLIALVMKTDPLKYLDYCTPAGILMLACIRLGCFMRGCCHGITMWIGVNPVIVPTQLIECTLDLFLLFFILKAEQARKFEKGLYAVFMGAYGVIRFLTEFFRDTPKTHFGMSNGQCFSILCVVIFTIYCIIRVQKAKHEENKL